MQSPILAATPRAADLAPAAGFAPSQLRSEEAEAAVATLLRFIGEDPTREGLVLTPVRVVAALGEHFAGYRSDPAELLRTTFEEVEGFEDLVVLRDISFQSHCEHHMAPIVGRAHVGYLPRNRVVGVGRLAALVESFAKRLQIQERLTAQVADTLDDVLQPRGVGVVIEGVHHCMTSRGVRQTEARMVTSRLLGEIKHNGETRREFMALIGRGDLSGPR